VSIRDGAGGVVERVISLLGCVAVTACSDTLADAARRSSSEPCEAPGPLAVLSLDLGEASGIARDPRIDNLLWLHNDSGNEPVLFAVDTAGHTLGAVPIVGATSSDLEDMALGECADGWCLYLADIGDNGAVRHDLSIHRLPLPALPDGGAAEIGEAVRPLATYHIEYPAGPRDAEALVVDAARGELLVISKGREDIVEMYAADLQELESARDPVTLRRIGRLAVPIGDGSQQYVTAADLSPNGSRLAVRAYSALYLFPWDGVAAFDTLMTPESTSLLAALEPQGEGVAFARDGRTVYLASEGREGRPPQLSRLVCP